MSWREKIPVIDFEYDLTLFAGRYLQFCLPARTRREAGLIKALWTEDEPADGFRTVQIEQRRRTERKQFSVLLKLYEVVGKQAKTKATFYIQHAHAGYVLADLWMRRGTRLQRRYVFRLWSPDIGLSDDAEVLYEAPVMKIPIGIHYQIGLDRKTSWSAKYQSDDVPF